ncbi:hypothetical protein ABID21_005017 [Pseudorhizobium tarimense]|uniref:Uncharacterized protein n=1 Tax=Pseudorhizobium tarimense TaxID=1079109 RepID=A0ABV2HF68_9HYPH|nr:hypothetical protein [Pseudorhizobium tarimense]
MLSLVAAGDNYDDGEGALLALGVSDDHRNRSGAAAIRTGSTALLAAASTGKTDVFRRLL